MKNNPNTLVVLGGALVKEKGRWHTPNFNGGDNFGICGSRLRIIGAGFLYRENPKQRVIVSGGKGQLKGILPGRITLASVLEGELISSGIPKFKIIKENKSGNTYQQLVELQKIIKSHRFLSRGKDVVIISNRYHLPRLLAMIKYANDLQLLKKMHESRVLKIVAAEDVMIKYKPLIWRKIIDQVYRSKAMEERVKLENIGAEQIKSGIYRFK